MSEQAVREERPKVVQIAVGVVPGMDNMSTPAVVLYALRDDGTIWYQPNPGRGGWWDQLDDPGEQIGFGPDRHYTAVAKLKDVLGDKYDEARKIVNNAGGRLG